ncbi:YtxH domain-containing protein [Ascidiimonas aurantiaca]|uniref:YtxH domain-containing protein n=1 Tax=Ascidiimonas aurantiaca TaxID=1685432 RepID=UPI0030EB29C9
MSNNTNIVLGVLAGTAIGATLGILFAPEKGSVTRKKISDQARKTTHEIGEKANQIKDAIIENVETQKASLDTRIDAIVTDASYKAEDLITSLESKLKTLKEKNKKLQSA